MYEPDLTSLSGFLTAMWDVTVGVLTLNPDVFTTVINTDGGGWVALAILFVAGISDMLGQSVVLFANRVTPRRFGWHQYHRFARTKLGDVMSPTAWLDQTDLLGALPFFFAPSNRHIDGRGRSGDESFRTRTWEKREKRQ